MFVLGAGHSGQPEWKITLKSSFLKLLRFWLLTVLANKEYFDVKQFCSGFVCTLEAEHCIRTRDDPGLQWGWSRRWENMGWATSFQFHPFAFSSNLVDRPTSIDLSILQLELKKGKDWKIFEAALWYLPFWSNFNCKCTTCLLGIEKTWHRWQIKKTTQTRALIICLLMIFCFVWRK